MKKTQTNSEPATLNGAWGSQISGTQFTSLGKSCLYVWMRDELCLYLGKSKNGIARLFRHHVIDIIEPVQPGDTFLFMHVPSSELDHYEQIWIDYMRPRYNIVHNPDRMDDLRPARLTSSLKQLCYTVVDHPNASAEHIHAAARSLRTGTLNPDLLRIVLASGQYEEQGKILT